MGRKSALFACPHCGEEKGWKCLNDPAANEMSTGRKVLTHYAFGLVGLVIAKAFYKGKKLTYRCEKCGFRAVYSPD